MESYLFQIPFLSVFSGRSTLNEILKGGMFPKRMRIKMDGTKMHCFERRECWNVKVCTCVQFQHSFFIVQGDEEERAKLNGKKREWTEAIWFYFFR